MAVSVLASQVVVIKRPEEIGFTKGSKSCGCQGDGVPVHPNLVWFHLFVGHGKATFLQTFYKCANFIPGKSPNLSGSLELFTDQRRVYMS